jgi:uncharacterized membrane protein YphA (DoxX/SURF4 family)
MGRIGETPGGSFDKPWSHQRYTGAARTRWNGLVRDVSRETWGHQFFVKELCWTSAKGLVRVYAKWMGMRWRDGVTAAGPLIYAVGIGVLGLLNFVYVDGVFGLEAMAAGSPWRVLVAYVTGIVLVAAAVSVFIGLGERVTASVLAVVVTLWVVVLHVPELVRAPGDANAWARAGETLALAGAAWALAGVVGVGRVCFGIGLAVVGALHVMYARLLVPFVPAWLPPGALFWVYLTGGARVVGGVAILTRVQARAAAAWLGLMFGVWVVIFHVPAVAAAPDARVQWTSFFVAVAMCGGAWVVASASPPAEAMAGRRRVDARVDVCEPRASWVRPGRDGRIRRGGR